MNTTPPITVESIREAEERINRLVDEIYVDEQGKAEPIYDGVVNPSLYLAAPIRVMWFLKEPWDGDGSSGGGWSLCTDHLNAKPVGKLGHTTFYPIIYIMYGLFHGVHEYDDMPGIREMIAPETLVRSIAFVNAKKLPGVKRGAYGPSIMHWYEKARHVLKMQIEAYAPQVIFGCSPHFPALMRELSNGQPTEVHTFKSAKYICHGNQILVHVYHPGQTQISRERYVNDAIGAYLQASSSKQTPSENDVSRQN